MKRYLLVMYSEEEFPDDYYGVEAKPSFFGTEEIPVYDNEGEDYLSNRIGQFLADFNGDYELYLLCGEIEHDYLKKIDDAAWKRVSEINKIREENERLEEEKKAKRKEECLRKLELEQLKQLKAKYEQL